MPAPRASTLRTSVNFEQATETRAADGGVTQTWAKKFTRWVEIKDRAGDEFYAADQTQAQITHLVTMRYDAAVTVEQRITDTQADRTFNIASVLDREGTRAKLELLCTQTTTGATK